jgi:hypothetical protein
VAEFAGVQVRMHIQAAQQLGRVCIRAWKRDSIIPAGTSEHPKRPFFESEGVAVFQAVSEIHCRQYGFMIDRQAQT